MTVVALFALRSASAKGLSVAVTCALAVSTTMSPGVSQTLTDPAQQTGAADPQAKQGDLSHLVYTAQTGLVARGISPEDGAILDTPSTSFEVATISGAGVEIAVNAQVVPAKKLGRRAILEDGTVRYKFYGILLEPGPNQVALTPLGADGLRGPSVIERIWGPGVPATIRAAGCERPRADGRTSCAVRMAVVDRWGHPAAPGATLKAVITGGDAVILQSGVTGGQVAPDLASQATWTSGGHRSIVVLLSVGSSATIQVVPGSVPGRILLDVAAADASTGVVLDAMAYVRPAIVTGLATIGIGAVPGEPGTDPTIADGTNSRLGRVALYGTGSIGGNAVGSLAYDTAGSLAATTSTGTLNADSNDRPYATYGDASIRRDDALSQDKLYARIDDGYDSAMWGEFQATTGPPGTAGTVALQVDGAKIALGSATTSASAFTAANQVGYGRQVLNPSGLATLDTLAHDNLIVGSETVTLASLDRLTGVIRGETRLANGVDYTVDYASGIIRFIDIPLPYDSSFNPQQVLVTYEYSALGGSAKTTGARFDAPLGRLDGIKFGLGYLNDVTGTGDFTLLTQSATGRLPGGVWSLSHAGSDGILPGVSATTGTDFGPAGSAFRFAGASANGPYKLGFGYDTTTPGYGNPFGDLATPGLTDYHASLLRTFGSRQSDFLLSYDSDTTVALTAGGGLSRASNLAATLHERAYSWLMFHAGLVMHASDTSAASATSGGSTAASPSASTAQAVLGVDWNAFKNLKFSLERDQTIGGSDATLPAQTTAQASWDLSGRGRIYASELLTDAPARGFGSIASVASATRAFALGIEQKVDPNTSVDSEYTVSGTGNARDVSAAIGVKERLLISRDLKGDAFVQRGVGSGSSGAGFVVYGLSFAYGDAAGRIKATGSLQDRTGEGDGATWSLGVAGKLFGDVSLVGADQGSRALGSDTTDSRAAIAWRPSRSDRGALFAGYERAAGNADVAGAQSGVVSLDGLYRPARRLELTGRYAMKTDGDSNYAVGTSLVGLGIRQQIDSHFDIGLETRAVLSRSTGGGLHSTAGELGTLVGGTLRLALGYNLGTTADPTLAAAPTRRGIYATLTTVIDRIFGWGAH